MVALGGFLYILGRKVYAPTIANNFIDNFKKICYNFFKTTNLFYTFCVLKTSD